MTSAIFWNWEAEAATWLANQALVRGTLILAAALVATRLFTRSSAAVRYAIWLLALAALVVGPGVSILRVAEREIDRAEARTVETRIVASQTLPEIGRSATHQTRPPRLRRHIPAVPASWLWMWMGGAVFLLLRLALHATHARRLRATAELPDARMFAVFERTKRGACPRSPAALRMHPDVTVPLVVGGARPLVLLPEWAAGWPEERLRSTFQHELAHVARRDCSAHLVSGAILALYWPTPLAWLVRRELDREREAACDERVIASGVRPAEYAQHLIDVARDAVASRRRPATALAGRGTGLADRVQAVLSGAVGGRWSYGRWSAAVIIALVATVLVSGIAPLSTQRGVRREEALRQLVSFVADTRRHGAWMLGELESVPDVAALEAALRDPSAEVRAAAAWSLGEIKDPASGPALAALLDDPAPLVREIAALSIGEIGDPAGIEPLLQGVDRHAELDGPTRWALGEIGGERLLRSRGFIASARELPDRDVWAGRLASAVPSQPGAQVQPLIDRLDSADPDARTAAALALGRLGDERAVDALLDALTDRAPEVRAAAVWALDEINPSR